jgi:two-component system OmpR family response regulator
MFKFFKASNKFNMLQEEWFGRTRPCRENIQDIQYFKDIKSCQDIQDIQYVQYFQGIQYFQDVRGRAVLPDPILVVDDDPHISEVVQFALKAAGYQVLAAADGETALELVKSGRPALAIVDINLPGKDGLWLCRAIRELSSLPIIFLSARDEEVDRVLGLTIGGDDYVTKPFSPRELTARVGAVLRRPRAIADAAAAAASPAAPERLETGLLSLDLESLKVCWDGRKIDLTATELKILKTLMSRPRKIFTREELLELAFPGVAVSDRTIDSHVLHIRKKFHQAGASEVILTQHGLGYGLAPTD